MRTTSLLVLMFAVSTAFAKPANLPPGAYLLVSAHDDGPSASGRGDLSVRRVEVAANGGGLSITVDGATTVIRMDESGGVLFTLPSGGSVTGDAVSQVVYVGSETTIEGGPVKIDGFYRIVWPRGEEKGRFTLVRDGARKG